MKDVGVYSWNELATRGVSQAQARRAVRAGDLTRLRRGWYARPNAEPDVVAAISRGGVLGCLSALKMHGVWVPEHATRLHVRANSENRRRPGQFCSRYGGVDIEAGPVDDLDVALRHSVRCLDEEGLVVVCDSILNKQLMTFPELVSTLSAVPESTRRVLARCDMRAQSGTETMVRLRLQSRRIPVTPQATIPGVGRVDLLIGERLIIETDSEEFHRGAEHYAEDRRRDREAIRRDYLPVRFTYPDVVRRWTASEKVVLDLVRAGRHRRGRHRPHR